MTDRRLRQRAVECRPEGKHCLWCGATVRLMVAHIDGSESNGSQKNLAPTCRSYNAKVAQVMKRVGLGRRTRQYNPRASEGAQTLAQWMAAVMLMKGESDQMNVSDRLDEPKNRVRYLTDQEESTLLSECGELLRTIVLLGIYAGLRISAEALTLRKDSVNLSRRLLTIEAAYSKNGETQTIPIHSKLVEPLRAQMKASRSEYVFEGRQRKDSIRTAFENACARARLRGVTPHILRHTFASRLAMAGVGNKTLQELGRWKRVEMIDRYAHPSPEHLAQAIEKIGQNSTTVFTTVEIQNDLKVGAK